MPSLRPVAAAFVVLGVYVGGWAVIAINLEHDLGVSHAGFGLINSLAVGVAALATVVGGSVAERRGTGPVLAAGFATWAVMLFVAAAVHARLAFGLLLIGVVAISGLLDVVMNVAATAALSDRPGALVRFHALFNIGSAIGAGGVGIALANGFSWRWAWIGSGVLAVPIAVACARTPLPAGEPGEHIKLRGTLTLLHREALLLIAAAFAAGAMVETGINLWGVLYIRSHLTSGLAVGAVSAVAAALVAAAARVFLGPAVGGRSAGFGVAVGGVVGAGGLLLLAYGRQSWLAGIGLVAAAAGMSMYWPLLLAYVSRATSRPGPIVGAMTASGYLGIVAGPAIVGWIASTFSLRGGLVFMAAAALLVAISPSRHRPPHTVGAQWVETTD